MFGIPLIVILAVLVIWAIERNGEATRDAIYDADPRNQIYFEPETEGEKAYRAEQKKKKEVEEACKKAEEEVKRQEAAKKGWIFLLIIGGIGFFFFLLVMGSAWTGKY